MSIDFREVVIKIKASAKCSTDEAWSGLAQAFLSLDRTRTEREQYWFLIHFGAIQVHAEISKKYLPIGEYQALHDEAFEGLMLPDDEWEFLNWFDEGPVREYARLMGEGLVKICSFNSVRTFLRKNYPKEASYENCRKVWARVRDCAARL
jgi:hypothetical protein